MNCKICGKELLVRIRIDMFYVAHLDVKHKDGFLECDITVVSTDASHRRKFAVMMLEDVNAINEFLLKWYDVNKRYILTGYSRTD